MNDKQKQIEEMATIICDMSFTCKTCQETRGSRECIASVWNKAQRIYNAGYRKIPKGSVVLTEEEHIEILGKIKMLEQLRKAITLIAKEFGVEL